jgi:hypothetical protein
MRLHVIVAMLAGKPARVECRSCHKQHNYKAGPPGSTPKKKAEGGAPRKTPARGKGEDKEHRESERPLEALLAGRKAEDARTYSPFDRYAVGDLVQHPSFGLGAVQSTPAPGKIEVVFHDSCKLLMHERPPAGASAGPKLQPPPRRDERQNVHMGASDAPPRK